LEERTAASSAPPEIRTESQRLRALVRPSTSLRAPLLEFTDETFGADVVDSPVPVIIDCWADTCGPCKLMHPVMRRIADAFGPRAKVGRLNVYENPLTTEALEIKAIPYILVVSHGDVVFELVGDRSFEDLLVKLEPFVP